MQFESVLAYLKKIYHGVGIPTSQLRKLALRSAYIEFEPQQWMYRRGEAAKGFYLILEGEAGNFKSRPLRAGDMVGFKEFIDRDYFQEDWGSVTMVKALFVNRPGYQVLEPFLDLKGRSVEA